MSNCFSCKKISDRSWRRKTNEVDITVVISEDGKNIILTGKGDLRHHLIEDSRILLQKIEEEGNV
jgi:imidazoleglycerol phosphate dehydratase HisB